jgi:hypothetical protein
MQVRVKQRVYMNDTIYEPGATLELPEGLFPTASSFEPVNEKDQKAFDAACQKLTDKRSAKREAARAEQIQDKAEELQAAMVLAREGMANVGRPSD